MDIKNAAFLRLAIDGNGSTMGLDNMLDNGETQARTNQFPAVVYIHPVKPFE